MPPQPDASCVWPSSEAGADVVMGLLTLGTFVSFLPLWASVLGARSSRGVSVAAMLLINLGNWLSTLGVGLQNWQRFLCCGGWGAGRCARAALPTCLVAANLAGALPIFCMVVAFFEPPPAAAADGGAGERAAVGCEAAPPCVSESGSEGGGVSAAGTRRTARSSAALSVVPQRGGCGGGAATRGRAALALSAHFAAMAATAGAAAGLLRAYGPGATAVGRYADAANLCSGVVQVFAWTPQIAHTYRLKDVGNLSMLTLAIQAPGALVVSASMIASGQRWTSVAQFVASFACVGFLLCECVYYVARQCPAGESRCAYVVRHGFLRQCRGRHPDDDEKEPLAAGECT